MLRDDVSPLPNPLDYLWMGNTTNAVRANGDPLVLERGDGIYLWDVNGNQYIDAIASLEASAIGHGRSEVADAVRDQYSLLEFYDTLRYTSRPTAALAKRLSSLSPMEGTRVHFATSGSEAVETALKTARQFHVIRGEVLRTKVIARRGGYHGCTMGAMALDGNYYRTKRHVFEPLPAVGRFVSVPTTAEMIADLIDFERPETVSAVVLDPMATASGVYPPDQGFWAELREVCDQRGVLLIADEVITAFGRTGRWFASAQEGIAPDIITISKALSSGYFPISGAMVSGAVNDVFESADQGLSHGHTFGGHPVAAAAALANLEIIEREDLVINAARVGAHLKSNLETLRAAHPLVADVRGEGLLYGIELQSRDAGRPTTELARHFLSRMRENGVLTFVLHPGSVVLICPPLIISEDQVDDLVGRIDRVLTQMESE